MSTQFNFKHLYYFWVVAKEGGMSRAADKLDMAVQTVSAQVRELERAIGCELLKPAGRGLTLTEAGATAMKLADQIFQIPYLAKRQNPTKSSFIGDPLVEPTQTAQMRSETRARLITNLAKASLWLDELIQGKIQDTYAIAEREKISEKTVRNLISLAFLSTITIKSVIV